jgi:hypothetical protein
MIIILIKEKMKILGLDTRGFLCFIDSDCFLC